MKQRLDKILASQGQLTRSQAGKLICGGSVRVNGKAVTDPALKADPETDAIEADGKLITYRRNIYIMMNKPEDVVSVSESPGEKNVIDLLPPEMKRKGLFPAGRLDKNTTGFVLITDDGDFAHEILSPARHVEKTYIATLSRPIPEEQLKAFEDGVELSDGYKCLPAKITVLSGDGLTVEIVLKEGKYHQVRRMAAACGSHVDKLSRKKLGGLELDPGLSPGDCRLLTDDELKMIGGQ